MIENVALENQLFQTKIELFSASGAWLAVVNAQS